MTRQPRETVSVVGKVRPVAAAMMVAGIMRPPRARPPARAIIVYEAQVAGVYLVTTEPPPRRMPWQFQCGRDRARGQQ